MSNAKKFHLAWFLAGWMQHGWLDTFAGDTATEWDKPELYIDMAHALERAKFDFLIIEDSSWVPDDWGGTSDYYVRAGASVMKQDPAVLASILTSHTRELGIVPTLSTTEYHPYMAARMLASLDHVSRGRAGWNVVTGHAPQTAANYGKEGHPEHDERYRQAHEFLDAAQALWNSWDPDAMVLDRKTGQWADPAKLHTPDFEGTYFRTRGPLNVAPPVQDGRPTIVQAGGSPAGRDFASKHADAIIAGVGTPEAMRKYRDDVRQRAVGHGRSADDVKVLFLCSPTIAETHEGALAKKEAERQVMLEHPQGYLAGLGYICHVDFSKCDLDTPISQLRHLLESEGGKNGNISSLQQFFEDAGDSTLREYAARATNWRLVDPVGTPDEVADWMGEAMEVAGGDGFLMIQNVINRHSISLVTDGLVPALQRRGLMRTEYAHPQLRHNLLSF
jgi:FMN-dependent oxidoreductase (nitrilotriacetate monooxygenase family)